MTFFLIVIHFFKKWLGLYGIRPFPVCLTFVLSERAGRIPSDNRHLSQWWHTGLHCCQIPDHKRFPQWWHLSSAAFLPPAVRSFQTVHEHMGLTNRNRKCLISYSYINHYINLIIFTILLEIKVKKQVRISSSVVYVHQIFAKSF